MPTHSRTSSSASSVGSSYVSSTDSNKTSHIESPTPLANSLEATNNFLNSNYHSITSANTMANTLPRYHNTYNTLISELNDVNEHLHSTNSTIHNSINEINNNHNANNGNGHVVVDGDGGGGDISGSAVNSYNIDVNGIDQMDDGAVSPTRQTQTIDDDKLIADDFDIGKTESIYGSIRPIQNSNGDEFAYKTLNGSVIRSVHPPGKGNSSSYKVNARIAFLFVFSLALSLVSSHSLSLHFISFNFCFVFLFFLMFCFNCCLLLLGVTLWPVQYLSTNNLTHSMKCGRSSIGSLNICETSKFIVRMHFCLQVKSNLGGPRPFAGVNAPRGGPRSPASYPPPSQNWSQPANNYASNTLPRSNVPGE